MRAVNTMFALLWFVWGIECYASMPNAFFVESKQHNKIMLNEIKVGDNFIQTKIKKDFVETIDKVTVETKQKKLRKVVSSLDIIHAESLTGEPLWFQKVLNIPNIKTKMKGVISDGKLVIKTVNAFSASEEQHPLPQPFVLFNGVRKGLMSALGKTDYFSYYSWNFVRSSFDFNELLIRVPSNRNHNRYWKILKTTTDEAGQVDESIYYTDADFFLSEVKYEMGGENFAIARCEQECINQKNYPYNNLRMSFVDSPYKLSSAARKGKIRYVLNFKHDERVSIPQTGEQRVYEKDGATYVDVCKDCRVDGPSANVRHYLAPNHWVQSRHPAIMKAAVRAAMSARSDRSKMRKLVAHTKKLMAGRIQYMGYGSALDALNTQVGDCTEYALLLAALARSMDIPTRIVIGLVYSSERFEGRRDVFIPHAWVQAWIDGGWKSYDAALRPFDAGYIALGVYDGNLKDYLGIVNNIHNVEVSHAAKVVKAKSSQARVIGRKK